MGTKPLFDQREKLLQVVRLLVTPHRLDLAGDLQRELPVPRHGVAHLANLKGNKTLLLVSVGRRIPDRAGNFLNPLFGRKPVILSSHVGV